MNSRDISRYFPLSTLGNLAWSATNIAANLLPAKRPHPTWAPAPLPKASEREQPNLCLPRSTKSICPECNRAAVDSVLHGDQPLSSFRDNPGVIDAEILEEAGRILMRKACPSHGPFEDVISNDPAFTRRMDSLYFGHDFVRSEPASVSAQGPFTVQTGRGSFLIVDLTNRCNMKCTPCFMDANNVHYVHEMSIDDVKGVFDNARSIKPYREISVLFSGGEPTIAPVFLDAIRYAKSVGFTRLHVATNGIRFAEDPVFALQAKAAGLHGVYLQIDGVTNAANQHRGIGNLFDVKCKALEHVSAAGLPVTLQVTVVNGLNNDSIGEIVQFAVQNSDKVHGVVFQPLMFAGRDAMVSDQERYERRYTLSDVAHDLSDQLQGSVQVMRDWFPMSAYSGISHLLDQMNPDAAQGSVYPDIHPTQGQFCPLIVNTETKTYTPLATFLDIDELLKDLRQIGDRFNGRLLTKLQVATVILRHFHADRAPAGLRVKDLAGIFRQMEGRFKVDRGTPDGGHWRLFIVGGMWFEDLFNIDLTVIQMSSTVVATTPGEISFCAYNAGGWRAMNEELNSTSRLSDWHKTHGRHAIYANGKLVNIEQMPLVSLGASVGQMESETKEIGVAI